jgi:chemotaxis protein CheD
MGDLISVGMGELKTGKESDVLAAYGIGSCVVVVCYDRDRHMAAMLHGILPEKPKKKQDLNKYLDTGIENLVKTMIDAGASINGLEAKLFGGARMFDVATAGSAIGERNVQKAKEVLAQKGIRITGEDTGATYGRNIEYFVNDRKAVVRSFMSGTKTI